MHYVYVVTNAVNGKRYVGVTNSPVRRWGDHRRCARRGSRYLLHQAIVKYGEEKFDFKIVEEHPTRQLAIDAEARLIDELETTKNGYNLSSGGAAPLLSDEGRMNLSLALLRHYASPEARKKTGDAQRGKPKSASHRRRIGLGQLGRIQSQETKQKISDAWARKRAVKDGVGSSHGPT